MIAEQWGKKNNQPTNKKQRTNKNKQTKDSPKQPGGALNSVLFPSTTFENKD